MTSTLMVLTYLYGEPTEHIKSVVKTNDDSVHFMGQLGRGGEQVIMSRSKVKEASVNVH